MIVCKELDCTLLVHSFAADLVSDAKGMLINPLFPDLKPSAAKRSTAPSGEWIILKTSGRLLNRCVQNCNTGAATQH